jgi:hypothetical protein
MSSKTGALDSLDRAGCPAEAGLARMGWEYHGFS